MVMCYQSPPFPAYPITRAAARRRGPAACLVQTNQQGTTVARSGQQWVAGWRPRGRMGGQTTSTRFSLCSLVSELNNSKVVLSNFVVFLRIPIFVSDARVRGGLQQ